MLGSNGVNCRSEASIFEWKEVTMAKKEAWNVLECVALAKRVLEQEGDTFESGACGVVFAFGKDNGHWTVTKAKPANGRWSKAKRAAHELVCSSLATEQGE